MKLHTRRSRAANVVKNWRARWQSYRDTTPHRRQMLEALSALGPDPDPDTVDTIIRNTSWTRCHCDECDQDCEMVMELGEERYYKSATAQVCHDCLVMALELMSKGSKE